MGACASVPKGLKAEVAGAAPPPEERKEETDTAEAPEASEVKAEEGEKQANDGEVVAFKDDGKVADDQVIN